MSPTLLARGDVAPGRRDRAVPWRRLLIIVTGRGSRTTSGAKIGGPLDQAAARHPGLRRQTAEIGDQQQPIFRYCTGRVPANRHLWLGQDPVSSIALATVPLGYGRPSPGHDVAPLLPAPSRRSASGRQCRNGRQPEARRGSSGRANAAVPIGSAFEWSVQAASTSMHRRVTGGSSRWSYSPRQTPKLSSTEVLAFGMTASAAGGLRRGRLPPPCRVHGAWST